VSVSCIGAQIKISLIKTFADMEDAMRFAGQQDRNPRFRKLAREYGLVDMTAEEISRMQSLITNLHSKEQRVRQDAIFGNLPDGAE